MKLQRDRLILDPLSGLEREPDRTVVIIFDAFDECDAGGAKEILQLLVDAIPSLPFFLKIFITSRPEKHIRNVLAPSRTNLHITILHDVESSVVKSDILLYLRSQLRILPAEKDEDLPTNWVTEDEIKLLGEAAGNLFIYITTSLRFLSDSFNLRGQLDVLLRIITSSQSGDEETNPFFHLDELYSEILRGLITPTNRAEGLRLLQTVLGSLVLLRNPLPASALERLSGLRKGDASSILNSLHSVILPAAPPHHCPRIYHPSFSDFLQDPMRCRDTNLFIDSQKHEGRMALQCLRLMNARLHRRMLGDIDPSLSNSEIQDLESKVRHAYEQELEYACIYWASHLIKANIRDTEVAACLAIFAAKTMLPWIEGMSWLGAMSSAVECLKTVKAWAVRVVFTLRLTKLR